MIVNQPEKTLGGGGGELQGNFNPWPILSNEDPKIGRAGPSFWQKIIIILNSNKQTIDTKP